MKNQRKAIETLPITTLSKKTKIASLAAALALLSLGAIQAQAQSVTYTFSDGTSDGFANAGFSSSPVATVQNIGGQNYIYLPLGGFQVGNDASDSAGNLAGFNAAMSAALQNPAGYTLSYNYYINSAAFTGATFLQVGTFLNTGSGYYSQDYGSPNELQLNGTQLASGQVFTGTVTVPLTVFAADTKAATETYFRLGIVENGNGTGVGIDLTDISVAPAAVPEPSSIALIGMGAVGLLKFARRRAS